MEALVLGIVLGVVLLPVACVVFVAAVMARRGVR